MAKDTLFTNDSGSAGGAVDYVKDVFDDVTLPASSNSGLTSTASTNPQDLLFGNSDLPRYGARQLFIKDLILESDRSKWISNKPTYRVVFKEYAPDVKAYVFGNFSTTADLGQQVINFRTIGDGVGVTGINRRVGFILDCSTASTATGQIVVDGANTTTVDFSGLIETVSGAPFNFSTVRRSNRIAMFNHASSNATEDLHDIRLTALQANTLSVVGFLVYTENGGQNVTQAAGTTYVDKNKSTTTVGATLPLPSFGSSLGGVSRIYKTSANAYAQSQRSATTIASIAQGSSGTNLLSVTTGHGASFGAGYGIVVPQGTSMYVGSVVSVSTDTLTVSPTLGFGISNLIYTAWKGGHSYAINASLMQLNEAIQFGVTTAILDPRGRYNVFSNNMGITIIDGAVVAAFRGGSGYLQIDGYFSALDFEYIGSNNHQATYSINGVPSWNFSAGQTGAIRRTAMTDAGPGWNSVVVQPGASFTAVGFNKINLYGLNGSNGVSFGTLAEIESLQAATERTAYNATMMGLGVHRRVYSDQLYLKGGWVRSVGASAAGGILYSGASTNSALSHSYFGKDFAIIGTGNSGNLSLDGVSISNVWGALKSVATEGFHTVAYTHLGGTAIISAIDYNRTFNDIEIVAKVDEEKLDPATDSTASGSSVNPNAYSAPASTVSGLSQIEVHTSAGIGSNNSSIRLFSTVKTNVGKAITYTVDTILGDYFTINEPGIYAITAVEGVDSANICVAGISKNSVNMTTSVNLIPEVERLAVSGVTSGAQPLQTSCASWTGILVAGDVIRAHIINASAPVTVALSSFSITKVG